MTRQPKLLGAAVVLSIVSMVLIVSRTAWPYRPAFLGDVIGDVIGDDVGNTVDDSVGSGVNDLTFWPKEKQDEEPVIQHWVPTLTSEAHKFKTAKDFPGHFFNITFLNSITLSQAKSTCNWETPGEVNFQFGEASSWGVNLDWVSHDEDEATLKKLRDAWRGFIRDKLLDFDRYVDRFSGRGIVMVGGQGRSLKRVAVILKQLKKLGCKLPVELHYWGSELTDNHGEELLKIWPNLHFNNLASNDNIVPTIYSGLVHYALKTAAMINSRFAHILMLDTDNIPVQDPETLFDSDIYKEYGTIFWPDIARTRPNNPIWPVTNTFCSMDEWEQESGQMLVNKMKYFYHLQLSHWFISDIDHGEFYRNLMLGDKDTFRFAWHALKTKYGIPPQWLTSVGTLHDDFYCGHTFAQYHPNGKIAFLHGGLLKTMRKEVVMWELEKNGGVFQAYKTSPHPSDNSFNPKTRMKFDGQHYLPEQYKPEGGLEASWCVDFDDVDPMPLADVLPGFQQRYEEIGGYWIREDKGDGSIWDGTL